MRFVVSSTFAENILLYDAFILNGCTGWALPLSDPACLPAVAQSSPSSRSTSVKAAQAE